MRRSSWDAHRRKLGIFWQTVCLLVPGPISVVMYNASFPVIFKHTQVSPIHFFYSHPEYHLAWPLAIILCPSIILQSNPQKYFIIYRHTEIYRYICSMLLNPKRKSQPSHSVLSTSWPSTWLSFSHFVYL